MERFIILSAALLLLGCVSEPIAYEDNKRILITGKVSSQGQVPMANAPVGAYIRTGGPAVQIGEGTIGEDGVLKVITLSPKDDINVHLELYSKFLEGYKEGITSYEVNGIHLSVQPNNTYVLPDLVMDDVVEAKVLFRIYDTNGKKVVDITKRPFMATTRDNYITLLNYLMKRTPYYQKK